MSKFGSGSFCLSFAAWRPNASLREAPPTSLHEVFRVGLWAGLGVRFFSGYGSTQLLKKLQHVIGP